MSHVDEGTLHALVDNELDAEERRSVEAHLATCGDCARRFAEATAMSRQVMTLLGALDEDRSAVRILPAAPAAPSISPSVAPSPDIAPGTVTPIRRQTFTMRRVALAASLLLVAGLSYEIGKRGDGAALEVPVPSAARSEAKSAVPRVMPSVVEAHPDSFVAAAAPSVRVKPRSGPRAESETTSADRSDAAGLAAPAPVMAPPLPTVAIVPQSAARKAVAPAQGQMLDSVGASSERRAVMAEAQAQTQARAQDRAPAGVRVMQAPAAPQAAPAQANQQTGRQTADERAREASALAGATVSGAGGAAKPTAPKAIPLAGYTAIEETSVPAMTRRRYVSASGVALELSIAQSFTAQKRSNAEDTASEFVVTTANGRSSVRWRDRGLDYELRGALAPDSLVKLATLLKP